MKPTFKYEPYEDTYRIKDSVGGMFIADCYLKEAIDYIEYLREELITMGGPGSGPRKGSGRSTVKKPKISLVKPGRGKPMRNTQKEVNGFMKRSSSKLSKGRK